MIFLSPKYLKQQLQQILGWFAHERNVKARADTTGTQRCNRTHADAAKRTDAALGVCKATAKRVERFFDSNADVWCWLLLGK